MKKIYPVFIVTFILAHGFFVMHYFLQEGKIVSLGKRVACSGCDR